MAQFVNIYKCDLHKGPVVTSLHQVFLGDVEANRVGVHVTDNGEDVTLSGTCSGTAILCNGGTVALTGTVDGSLAYVDLPSAVYTVEGPVEIYVTLTQGDQTTTLLTAHGNAVRTDSGVVIDPGTIIPSVAALISDIDGAIASIPADYSDLLGSLAPTFSSSTAYAAGDYVWYDGDLYQFTAAHAAGSWSGTDASAAVLTSEVSDLKGALSLKFITADNYELGNISIENSGWTYGSSTKRIRTKQGTTIRLYKGDTITVADNSTVEFAVGWLNDSGIYNLSSGWKTAFECPVTADYVILAHNNPETTISDVAAVADDIIIHSSVDVMTIKTLSTDVGDVKDHLKIVNDIVGIYNPNVSNFSIGDISVTNSGWSYSDRATRVRTNSGYTIALKKGDVIGLTDYTDARMYIGWQKTDGTYGSSGAWKTSDFTCTDDGNYVILLCHLTDKRLNSIDELLSLLLIIIKPVDLAEQVNNIDETVNNIVSGTLYNTPTKFGNWAAPSLNWAYKSGTTRLYAEDVDVSLFKAIRYSLPQGYQLGVVTKTVDKEQIRDYGWDSNGDGYRLFSGATYATLALRKSNDAKITVDDVTNDFRFALFGSKSYSYNDGPIQTVYHRGCDFAAPENTLASFKLAAKERGIYVETDVRYTSDGVAVLLHDETINRTGRNADGSEISTTINISDITYAQALEYDFGIWKGASFAGEKIPSFDEFCMLCALYGLHPVVELKGNSTVQTAERVKTLYQTAIKYGLKGRISWISSAYQTHLPALTEVDAGVDFWWLTNLDASHVQEALSLTTETNHIVVDTGISYATSANQTLIDTLTSAGVGVTVWTANTVNDFTNLATIRGITWITTDGTDAVVALLLANGV